MKTTEIKQKTINKCLSVLKEMKHRADLGFPINANEIIKGHKTNQAISSAVIKLEYFKVITLNTWVCNKTRFDPIDARNVIEFIYEHYQNKHKRTKENNDTLFNVDKIDDIRLHNVEIKEKLQIVIPPSKQEVENYCKSIEFKLDIDYWFDYYNQRNWKVGKNKMKSWKRVVQTWKMNEKRYANGTVIINKTDKSDISDFSDKEVVDEVMNRSIWL